MIIQALALESPYSNYYHLSMIYPESSPINRNLSSLSPPEPAPATEILAGLPNGARLILAPLCGITTSMFRKICYRRGADMAVSEMISSEALIRGRYDKIRAVIGLDVTEGPLSLQFVGGNPERMGDAAARLSELNPEYVDINLGCPVRKIVRRNGGSAVLKNVKLLGEICSQVVRRSRVPVSAKIRAGWDKPSGEKIREISRTVEDSGVSMLAVHARTRQQDFSEQADWRLIAAAKDAVSIPVVGNGDVKNADDVVDMSRKTGCDAVMIGRAAIGNPWVFEEARARLDERRYSPPTPGERIGVLLEHVRGAIKLQGEPLGIIATRTVMSAYVKRLPGARQLRGTLSRINSYAELEDLLESYLVYHGL